MTTESKVLLTPEQLVSFRGPIGGGRMLSAKESRALLNAYEAALDCAAERKVMLDRVSGALCVCMAALGEITVGAQTGYEARLVYTIACDALDAAKGGPR